VTIIIDAQAEPTPAPAHLHGIYHDAAGFHPLASRCRGCRKCAKKAAEHPTLITHEVAR